MSNAQSLDIKPLEVNDFSGGMTDYYLLGASNRFQKADNFLINVDKQLETRFGSVGFDKYGNHKLPGQPARVDAFLLYEKKEILVNRARDIYYLDSTPAWTRIVGPSGNEALGAGASYSQASWRDWRNHVYVTNDAGPIPSKIYKDYSGNFQVLTVGLPEPKASPQYTEASLLSTCIALANDLRTSMVQHIQDVSNTQPSLGPQPGTLHGLVDKYSLCYFIAQSFLFGETPPDPLPTPAPNATDETSLYALTLALCLAYEHHAYDPAVNESHYEIQVNGSIPPKGPYQRLEDNTLPTTVEQAAMELNELRQKWNWHRRALYSHSNFNDRSLDDRYEVIAPAISYSNTLDGIDLSGVPVFQSNYQDVIRYANYLKNAYNRHVTNNLLGADWGASLTAADYHSQLMNDVFFHTCTAPDATDLDSSYLLIYQIWVLYAGLHVFDSNFSTHTNITFDTTASSANITAVADDSGAVTLAQGSWVWSGGAQIFNDTDVNNQQAAQVVSSGSGTATLSKTLQGTDSGALGQVSSSVYHVSTDPAQGFPSNFVNSTSSRAGPGEFLDPAPGSGITSDMQNLPPSLGAWVELASQIFNAMALHEANGFSHPESNAIVNHLAGDGPFFKPEVVQYGYAFVFENTYKVESGVEFTNRSAPLFVGPIETGKVYPVRTTVPSGIDGVPDATVESPITSTPITNLPVLVNDQTTNYDTVNANLEIYRTVDDGNTYYLLASLDNGTTSYVDSTSDTIDSPANDRLDTRQQLYTTGGVVGNTQPPPSRYLHILNNTGYYGYITDGTQVFKTRILQSVPGAPDAVPLDFSVDIEDEISGLSAARNNLVVLGLSSAYRLQGGYDLRGQGVLTAETISDEKGCISGSSIVRTEIGLFFAGNDGFYYTDGFQLIKISIDLDITYASRTKTPVQAKRIYGTYDKLMRRVWWTMQSNPYLDECDEAFIFYLNYGVKPSGVFTTASGGNNWQAGALLFMGGDMIRGDARGLLFRHSSIYRSDPVVPTDLDLPLEDWQTSHIPFDYRSCALDFGTTYKGQWVTKVHMLGENMGNAAIQYWSIADNINDPRGRRPVAPIYYQDNLTWGNPTIVWGDNGVVWRYDGKLDFWRRFSAKTLRSQVKQVQILPAKVGVYNSDGFAGAEAQVAGAGDFANLLNPAGFTAMVWPLDCIGMVISFSNDNYVAEFPIVDLVDGNVLIFEDPEGLLNDTFNATWVIRGYPKEAGVGLVSYVIHYANMGNRGRAYRGPTSRGENA